MDSCRPGNSLVDGCTLAQTELWPYVVAMREKRSSPLLLPQGPLEGGISTSHGHRGTEEQKKTRTCIRGLQPARTSCCRLGLLRPLDDQVHPLEVLHDLVQTRCSGWCSIRNVCYCCSCTCSGGGMWFTWTVEWCPVNGKRVGIQQLSHPGKLLYKTRSIRTN